MEQWWKYWLRACALGSGAFVSVLAVPGCPGETCDQCKSISAVAEVNPPTPSTITEVSVTATGVFTGHCPNPPYHQDCNLTETFLSTSTDPGKHTIPLEGWEFDENDTVSGTMLVEYDDQNGNPQTMTIENSEIDWE